eukprot:scaffold340_cov256-Pinguiococcus_pyrenoidosus.AAC.28
MLQVVRSVALPFEGEGPALRLGHLLRSLLVGIGVQPVALVASTCPGALYFACARSSSPLVLSSPRRSSRTAGWKPHLLASNSRHLVTVADGGNLEPKMTDLSGKSPPNGQ